ncbi:MAG TPA: heavy metal translocating P-type ATPase metal-binding domain-containing protein [Flavipsychrobacter sp.]|nr:heavy metal translocating P-type ATPase metal-binding domain-containing protein [Flavipsychrobacter sp.]
MLTLTDTIPGTKQAKTEVHCYHCGAVCLQQGLQYREKPFCCTGCQLVYELLEHNGLCDYYSLQSHPGLSQVKPVRKEKYAYLDEPTLAKQLYCFSDGNHTIVTFFIPGIHCASCMWLLEHLQQLHQGITESRINFSTKEVTIKFRLAEISLREVAELLATIGYEPSIHLENHLSKNQPINKSRLYKLGVAGFCFGNIMLISLPEYLSGNSGIEHRYALLFRILNLILSIPVFFYSASEFFHTAWTGLKQKTLNIDAPVVLALIITYARSLYEIITDTGAGYLDSMTGIVFFMLVGRIVQERTYRFLSFHRDYKAYFPMAATVVSDNSTASKPIGELQQHDLVKIYHQELIPADGRVIEGHALIDYSFVTGENEPVAIAPGQKIFAGGRQMGESVLVEVLKPVNSSYLTSLWNHKTFSKNKEEQNDKDSFIHVLSRYFSIVLFVLAGMTALYWWKVNAQMMLPSVSAMLIVACPCALLLTAVYTNGNLLRILSDNGLYLRDATVIEQLGNANQLVFDKTGTLTHTGNSCEIKGYTLTEEEMDVVYTIVAASMHPVSRQLAGHLGRRASVPVASWREEPGEGIEAHYKDILIRIGSADWTGAYVPGADFPAEVYVRYGEQLTAFCWQPELRPGAAIMLNELRSEYELSLLSGDHDRHRKTFEKLFDKDTMYFEQKPVDKLEFIEQLQERGQRVVMIGDGLNDAGALQQSNAGITLTDDINNFSPSCDAILRADQLSKLPAMLKMTRLAKTIVHCCFAISILYNIVGLTISMRGEMSPMIAAILMPLSTLTIVLVTTGASNYIASRLGLSRRKETVV